MHTHGSQTVPLLHSISGEEFVDKPAFIESAQDLVVNQIFDFGVSQLGITDLHQPLDVAQTI